MKQTNEKVTTKTQKEPFTEYKCNICKKVFSEKAGLTTHLPTHSTERPFECRICFHRFKIKKYLSRHVKKVHNAATDNECVLCGRKFHYKSLLIQHMYIHTDERPYKCNLCGKGFNSNYTLNTHSYIHSGTKPFKCEFCDYACRDSSTLRKHQARHMGVQKRYQCRLCDKSYCAKNKLKVHVKSVHLDINVNRSPCEKCGKTFKNNASLNIHIKTVHERNYSCKCEICGVTISNRYNMAAHLTKHSDFRPFKCNFGACDKRFKERSALKKHIIVHYPEKHLSCEICNKKFTRPGRLTSHLNQHRVKRKCVECDYCGKSFYNKNYLSSHIQRRHVHQQQYVCDDCGFRTHNKPSIVMHIKSGHDSELDRECKICNKIYKKHVYLKNHYWNTHCVRYNMTVTKKKTRKRVIIIKEPNNCKEKLLDKIKEEALSGKRATDTNNTSEENKLEIDFNEYFEVKITSAAESSCFTRVAPDKNITIDKKCQREAEIYIKKLIEDKRKRKERKLLERARREYNKRLKTLSKNIRKSSDKNVINFVKTNDNDKNECNYKETVNSESDESDENNETNKSNESIQTNTNDVVNDNNNEVSTEKLNEAEAAQNDDDNERGLTQSERNDSVITNVNTQDSKLIINIHQCYVCFKLYETKEQLMKHCQRHFDVCSTNTLKKCPLCDYVTEANLKRHMVSVHKLKLKAWKELNRSNKNQIETIPSVKSLNKQAYMELDKREREKEKGLIKKTLVKKNGEWIIQKNVQTEYEKYLLPKYIINDDPIVKGSGNYLDRLKSLYRLAKKNGRQMIFPCENCQKICQNVSALTLHTRKHEHDPKPFKKKTWKHKITETEMGGTRKEMGKNRYESPNPVVNKHKCDERLIRFYEQNVKGGDVEFWHFLKIVNKMSRENINDFTDLENRTDFGIHIPQNVDNNEMGDNATEKTVRGKLKRTRKILISRKEHVKRKFLIEEMRQRNFAEK